MWGGEGSGMCCVVILLSLFGFSYSQYKQMFFAHGCYFSISKIP